MNQELEYLRNKLNDLLGELRFTKEVLESKKQLQELMEEEQGMLKEEIRLLKNQLHSNGKKPKVPKKPELDWNQKMRLIQDCLPEYQWEGVIGGPLGKKRLKINSPAYLIPILNILLVFFMKTPLKKAKRL